MFISLITLYLEEIGVISMGRKINSGLSSGVHGQLSLENFELLNKLNNLNIYQFKNNVYPHKLPIKYNPNSKIEQKDEYGNVVRIRYYDEKVMLIRMLIILIMGDLTDIKFLIHI